MPLSVIGAGFGRTGTESMKLALELLELGPCHHMKEVLGDPEQTALWRGIAAGDPPDWEAAFAGYSAAVDWPSAFFWRELADVYPDAKILLTLRSPESWHASMGKTIFRTLRESTDPDSLGVKLVAEGVFDGRLDDPAHAIAMYERNNAEVQAAFPPERLLTYHLGDGWEPLCQFLDKQVPSSPYPRSNSTVEFNATIDKINKIDKE